MSDRLVPEAAVARALSDGGGSPRAWALCEALLREGQACRLTVSGASMYPFIRDGDVVIVSPFGTRPPRVGQVVMARDASSGRVVVHRLLAYGATGVWRVKGDACLGAGEYFPESSIVGVVTGRERGGRRLSRLPLMPGLAGGLSRMVAGLRVRVLLCSGRLKRETEA